MIVYSTPTCQYCHAAKHLFDQFSVPYRDVDVSTDPYAAQEMFQKSGQMGTPVIDINGAVIVGYEPGRIMGTLRQYGYVR